MSERLRDALMLRTFNECLLFNPICIAGTACPRRSHLKVGHLGYVEPNEKDLAIPSFNESSAAVLRTLSIACQSICPMHDRLLRPIPFRRDGHILAKRPHRYFADKAALRCVLISVVTRRVVLISSGGPPRWLSLYAIGCLAADCVHWNPSHEP